MKKYWLCAVAALELLAWPILAEAQPAKLAIIISIDGLHQADLMDPALKMQVPHILELAQGGVWYSQAMGPFPSDSFPGTLAYLTGAGPATTGVYYDDTFCRSLVAPGSTAGATPGVNVQNTEAIDKDDTLIDGGGDCGLSSLDVTKLLLDPARGLTPAWPHNYLKVNTIFEVVHAAGLRTCMMDKHPAYEIAAGPSGTGIDDLYCPEIQAKAALIDGKLVDSATAPADTRLKGINKSVPLAMAYDDLKIEALLRQLHGQDARGDQHPGVPALICINLQALNIAEKGKSGGIDLVDGREVPSADILSALAHCDQAAERVESELKSAGLWDHSLIVLTAKHGQDPRIGSAHCFDKSTILDPLKSAGIPVLATTLDDVALLWLKNPSQADQAAKVLQEVQSSKENPGISTVFWGDSLKAANLAGPEDRSPDIILALVPGTLFTDKAKRSDHGGSCDDARHVPIVLAGGALDSEHRGLTVSADVKTTQISMTVLDALGLDSSSLQGARIEHTEALPNTGLQGAVGRQAGLHQ